MIRVASMLLVAGALLVAGPVQGQKSKSVVGNAAPTFSDLPGVDGKKHSLSDYKKDVVVVVVTCNHCPIAVAYENRLIDFTKKFGEKVDVVAINVNNLEADKLPKMIERAKDKGFNFAYLYDESQKVGRDYNASVTPEFYVINKERKVVYHGAMDDNNNAKSVKTNYLEPAVSAALEGKSVTQAITKARGCSVKYDK